MLGVQIQSSWAYGNNVNLLASGVNDANWASSGSGIFSGRRGALKTFVTGERMSTIVVSVVPKNPGTVEIPLQQLPEQIPQIEVWRENLNGHSRVIIKPTGLDESREICHNEFCCTFTYALETVDIVGESAYSYVAAAIHGYRVFTNGARLKVFNCAMFACTDNEDYTTCATQ